MADILEFWCGFFVENSPNLLILGHCQCKEKVNSHRRNTVDHGNVPGGVNNEGTNQKNALVSYTLRKSMD